MTGTDVPDPQHGRTAGAQRKLVPSPPVGSRGGRVALGAVGLLLIFGPLVVWLLGGRAEMIENRPFSAAPKLSQGFEIADQTTAFFTDRLPIRGQAVDLRREVSERIFREPPLAAAGGGPIGAGGESATGTAYEQSRSQQVLEGRDGWLYYGEEFVRACRPEQSLDESMRQLRRLTTALTAAGKQVVVVIMPDKSTVERDFLPSDLPERDCAFTEKDQRLAALRGAGMPELLDMAAVLEALREEIGAPVYVPIDTHTTTRGSAEYVRAVVARLDPRVARTAELVEGPDPFVYAGDLSVLLGDPQQVSEPLLSFERPGVVRADEEVAQPLEQYFVTRLRATGTRQRPVVDGRTVWYGDSFTQRALPNIGAFFADVWRVPELSQPAALDDPDQAVDVLVSQIRQARNVVIEQTERIALGKVDGSILRPETVDRIVAALEADPGVR